MKGLLKKYWLLLPLWWVAFHATAQESGQSFTLQQCIEYALKNSLDVRNAQIEQLKAQSEVKEIIADGLPQVDGRLNYTNNPTVQAAFIDDFISPPIDGALFQAGAIDELPDSYDPLQAQFGTTHTTLANITLRQLVFDGSFFIGLQAARTYTELYDKQALETKTDVAANVSKAYYAVLINKERLNLAEINVIRLDTLVNQTKGMYENGFSEKIDYDRVRVSFNNSKTLRNNLIKLVKLNEQILKFQMGMDINEEIVLAETLENSSLETPFEGTGESFDYKNRIEYSVLETQEDLAELDLKRIQSLYLPDLYLDANMGWNAGANELSQLEWVRFSSIGLTLSVPIFDGLRKMRQAEQARLSMEQVRISKANLENQINFEQQQQEITLSNALGDLESQKQNMDLAQEIYRVTKIKYQEGVGTTLEVVDAESAYKEAENNYYNALYDAIVAKIDFDKAYGRLIAE